MATKKVYLRAASGEVFETTHPEYHKECERVTYKERQDYARKELRRMVKPKQTVYCVSRSGMSREISLFIVNKGELRNIDCLASDAMGHTIGKQGIKTHGCGMGMGFHLVYSLGRSLWPNGTPKPHGTRNGEPDIDGGYALEHSCL